MLSANEMQLMMIHLVRSRPTLSKASTVLNPNDFYNDSERMYALVWAASQQWFLEHGAPAPRNWLQVDISRRLREDPSFLSDTEKTELVAFVDLAYSLDADDLCTAAALQLVEMFLQDRRTKNIARQLAEMSGEEFTAKLDELNRASSQSRLKTGDDAIMFPASGVDDMGSHVRTLTNINWLDLLLGGGEMPGEVYGLLGCTGGGKTTTAVALCCEKALAGRNVAYMNFENGIDKQIKRRFYGYILNAPKHVMDGVNRIPDDLPSEFKSRYKEVIDKYDINKRLRLVDMKSNGVGMAGIAAVKDKLKQFEDQGTPISSVVIDQFEPMVMAYMSGMNKGEEHRRAYMQKMLRDIVDMCAMDQMKCTAWVLHQMRTDAKDKTPLRKPKQGDAADDRSFENWIHFCIALGVLDSEQRCWAAATKAREAPASAVIVKVQGDRYRVTYKPDKYKVGGNGFVTIGLDDADTAHAFKPEAGRARSALDMESEVAE